MDTKAWGTLARVAALAGAAGLAVLVLAFGNALIGGQPLESAAPSVAASASASESDPPVSPTPSQSSFGEIPVDLLDVAWLGFDRTAWRAGTLGDGATLTLPADEYGLGTGGGMVLSVDSETSSTLFARDVTSGETVYKLETRIRIDDAVVSGDQFFLAGIIDGGDSGVWVGRVGDTELTQLIPASEGALLGDYGTFRTGIKLSPTGQTLASTVCAAPQCVTQIVSTQGGSVQTIADAIARWVSEEYVVINERPHVRGYRLTDGALRWQMDDVDFWDGLFASDGRSFIAQAQVPSESAMVNEIWRVDTETGSHDVVRTLAVDAYLFSQLSTEKYGFLLTSTSVGDALFAGAAFEVFDVTSGELVTSQSFIRSAP